MVYTRLLDERDLPAADRAALESAFSEVEERHGMRELLVSPTLSEDFDAPSKQAAWERVWGA